VSKRHALLEQVGQDWLIRDDSSTNGLYWQGRPIRQLLLRDGDALRFGPPSEPGLPELVFQSRSRPRLLRLAASASLAAAAAAIAGVGLLGLSLLRVPVRGSLAPVRGPLALYDRQNRPLNSPESSEHRENKTLSGYPSVLVEALLASEDSRFWWHPGVDPIGDGPGPGHQRAGRQGAGGGQHAYPAAGPQPLSRTGGPGGKPWCANGGNCSWPCSWRRVSARQTCC